MKNTKNPRPLDECMREAWKEAAEIYWISIIFKEIDDPSVPITKKHRAQAKILKETVERECPSLRVVAGVDIDLDPDVDVWVIYVIPQGPQGEHRPLTFEETKTLTRLGIGAGESCAVVEIVDIAATIARIGDLMENIGEQKGK
jgi:hypothetical protein